MSDNLLYWVWLSSAQRMNTFKIKNIKNRFRDPKKVYDASVDELCEVKGITSQDVKTLSDKSISRAENIMKAMERENVDIVTIEDEEYPAPFKDIEYPPYVLYMKGIKMDWENMLGLTVIGTRKYTQYGADVTRLMCEPLTKAGFTVISGMASGVDGAAAKAALDAGGKTVAVLGSGIDVIYPKENTDLFNRIVENGVVMTEYPPGTRPLPYNFPHRNRLMSALGKGVLIAEAPTRSGALITASQALDMGKNVFAVPGSVFKENSGGVNMLIQQGAKPVMHPRDIMCEYFSDTSAVDYVRADVYDSESVIKNEPSEYVKPRNEKKRADVKKSESTAPRAEENKKEDTERYSELNEREKKIIALLTERNYGTDELARALDIKISELNNILVVLEIRGFISRLAGNNYKIN